jgi:predicted GNAT superfamily acetyltransferase
MGAGETPEANEIDEISGNAAAIEIPANINELQKRDMALAIRWREATRQAFVSAFDAGFVADGFQRGNRNTNDYGVYILNRKG